MLGSDTPVTPNTNACLGNRPHYHKTEESRELEKFGKLQKQDTICSVLCNSMDSGITGATAWILTVLVRRISTTNIVSKRLHLQDQKIIGLPNLSMINCDPERNRICPLYLKLFIVL